MSFSQGEYDPPTFLFEDGDFLEHVVHHGSNHYDNNHYNDNNNYNNNNNNNNDNHYNENILHNIQNNTIHADAVGNRIPTETQLVLLCLDYLRDLRRSYPDVEDMTHAEGLDGDYVSLAVWALSRAFVRPGKLTLARESAHGDADVDVHGDGHGHGHGDGRADPIRMATQLMSMTVNGDGTLGLAEDGRRRKHKHHNSKEAKVPILAAGGMNGEKAFGNDAWYRQLSFREERELQKGMEEMIETSNSNDNCDEYPDGMMQQHYRRWMTENLENKSVARLSETICIPSIEDITNEVMLRIPIGLSSSPTSPDEEDEDEEIEDSTLIYEYNDNHASNAHRFYLLRGLASGTDDPSTSKCNRNTHPSLHGGPIALGEIAVAGLAALGARSRIDAERDMVFENPLFEQFVRAAASKGFFQEKKEDGDDDRDRGGNGSGRKSKSKSKHHPQHPPPSQPPDEQRSRTMYEEKYRKVVTKFRSKLAMKMEDERSRNPSGTASRGHTPMSVAGSVVGGSFFSSSSPMHHPLGGGLGRTSPYHHRGAASPSNASVHSTGGDSQASLQNLSVAERHRVRREIRLERSRMHRDRSEERRGVAGGRGRDGVDAVFRRKVPQSGDEREERGRGHRGEVSRRESRPQSMDPSPRHNDALKGRKGVEQDQKNERHRQEFDNQIDESNRHPLHHQDEENEHDEDASPPHPREPEQLNSEGNRLMQQKRFEHALDCYSAALELAPDGPNSHVYYSNRAAAFLSINDYESSIDDSERALSLKPDYAKAHARLGLAYFVSGRYDEAVEAYEEALEHDPENEWCRGHYEQAKLKLEFERQKTRSAKPKNRTNTSQPHLSHSSQEQQQQQQQHRQIYQEERDQEDFQSDDEGEEEGVEGEEEEEEEEGEEEEEEEEEEQDAMEAQSSIETHFKFYPSLDLTLHPDGACLDDGNEPGEYALNADEFLFDSREECCAAWFLDADLCLAATGHGTGALLPTSSPTVEDVTPWPTWSDDVFDDDDDDDDEDDDDEVDGRCQVAWVDVFMMEPNPKM